jgi:hypothetical protein
MIESVRPVVALKMLRLLKDNMRENKVDLLESDLELSLSTTLNDKCILIDGRVNEIIESGDSSRLKNIVLLESFNDDKVLNRYQKNRKIISK